MGLSAAIALIGLVLVALVMKTRGTSAGLPLPHDSDFVPTEGEREAYAEAELEESSSE